jgi:hypothetical protein
MRVKRHVVAQGGSPTDHDVGMERHVIAYRDIVIDHHVGADTGFDTQPHTLSDDRTLMYSRTPWWGRMEVIQKGRERRPRILYDDTASPILYLGVQFLGNEERAGSGTREPLEILPVDEQPQLGVAGVVQGRHTRNAHFDVSRRTPPDEGCELR